MKKLTVYLTLVLFMLIYSCKKDETPYKYGFNDVLGKWSGRGYGAGGLVDNNMNRYVLDSADWYSQLELYSDSTCYYMEYREGVDTFTVTDTGSFYVKNNWLYLRDIQPVYIGFGDPIGGRLDFDTRGMILCYDIIIPEIGVDGNVRRVYSPMDE